MAHTQGQGGYEHNSYGNAHHQLLKLNVPNGMRLTHPTSELLTEWATLGCPTWMGNPWTEEETREAVRGGPHWLALLSEAIAHFANKAAEKVCTKQACIVAWDDIKDNPPR
jgi:hypothetical protein